MQKIFRWILISSLIGLVAGLLSAFFLQTLNLVTAFRETHSELIWFLPLAGLFVGLLYHYFGSRVEGGNNLILDEIHQPQSTLPFRMVPLILVGTWVTHLFGGSAGREGTAVQMGASAADQLTARFGLSGDERTTLLMAGMSAGFGAVFGVPFAGAMFGLEVLAIGGLRFRRVLECTLASFVGHYTVLFLGVQHTHYMPPVLPSVTFSVVALVVIAGLLFGLAALAFSRTIHFVGSTFRRAIRYAPLRPFVGGVLVVAGYWILGAANGGGGIGSAIGVGSMSGVGSVAATGAGTSVGAGSAAGAGAVAGVLTLTANPLRYAGLGVPVIQDSLVTALPAQDFLYKSVFTILTLGSGMKGGEVTPLLFIGATFGNSLAQLLPLGFSLLAALGFVAVFAGAANTPLACTLMAMEIFGPGIGLLALVACSCAWLTSGHHGIYKSQRIQRYKPAVWLARLRR